MIHEGSSVGGIKKTCAKRSVCAPIISIFRVIVGDEDGHGKNFSVMLDNGVVSLAPLYDSLCTVVYPEMAEQIGEKLTSLDESLAGGPIGEQVIAAIAARVNRLQRGQRLGLDAAESGPGRLTATTLDDVTAGRRAR